MAFTTWIHGHLQIDHKLGIVYFHADPQEQDKGTVEIPLKIVGLGKLTFPLGNGQVEITFKAGDVRIKRGVIVESTATFVEPFEWAKRKKNE